MKHAKLINSLLTFLILIILLGSSQNYYAQITKVISFSKQELKFKITKDKKGTEYQEVNIKSLEKINKPGKPEIPTKILRLLISPNEEVEKIIVNIKQSELINLEKKLIPSRNFSQEITIPENLIYESEYPYPREIITKVSDGYFDGSNHIIMLEISPIRYYPKKDMIEFISELQFEIKTKSSVLFRTRIGRMGDDKEFYESALKSLIDNPEDISLYSNLYLNKSITGVTTGPLPAYEYVVIMILPLKLQQKVKQPLC
jgi:hypothetical protein